MKMITEATIEKMLEQFEKQEVLYDEAVQEFVDKQPALFSFLIADSEGVFTEEEQDFMLYLAIVVYKSVEKSAGTDLPEVGIDDIADAEEANWAKMEDSKGDTFRDRLDPFFDGTPQEDLLAFVEDALTGEAEDEDGEVFSMTEESQEPMFVTLKTVVDVLTNSL